MESQGRIPILVVEDDLTIKDLLKAAMESSNYDLTMAGTIREATHAIANKGAFQLILCDLSLPDSGPEETIPAMVQMAGKVPVVAMTGWSDEATSKLVRKQGAKEVLLKGCFCWCRELAPFLNRVLGLEISTRG